MPAATPSDRIQRSFARSQHSYHAAALAQAQIAGLLTDALLRAGAPPRFHQALEFGCGTGHFTQSLLHRFSIERLILNDLVAQSADALPAILQAHKTEATFHTGPIETLPLAGPFDLIASASTVQWVADPAALTARLTGHLAPGGWLAISGFGRDHFAELRAVGGAAEAPSYLDPADWRAMLPADLTVHSVEKHRIALAFNDGISLLRHLRDTGVNANTRRHWTRAKLAEFEVSLRASQPGNRPITLTYCPVFVIAQRRL